MPVEKIRNAESPMNRNIVMHGFGIMCRNWPAFFWTYAMNLLFALLSAQVLMSKLNPLLDHSMAAQSLAGPLHVIALAGASMQLRESLPAVTTSSVLFDCLFVLFAFITTPAVLSMYLDQERATLGNMFRTGFRFFWRFVRIAIVWGIITLLVVGALNMLRMGLLNRLDKTIVERPYFIWSAVTFSIVMLFAVYIRIWFDVAEIIVVDRGWYRFGRAEDRRVRRTIMPAMRMMHRRFWSLMVAVIFARLIGAACLIAAVWIWKDLVHPGSWFMAFVISQIGLFILLASRFWMRGIEVAWAVEDGTLVTPDAVRISPLEEPPVPAYAAVPSAAPEPASGPVPPANPSPA
jgi:hypothetical protein